MNAVIKKLIPLADKHRKADEYIAGTYWEGNGNGKGCAVGCTIHDAIKLGILDKGTSHDSHQSIAEATKLPKMLWHLADHIFEGLPTADRPQWTPRFLRAASKCKNAEHVPARIMHRLAKRLADDAVRDDVKQASLRTASLWLRRVNGDDPPKAEWDAARQQAYAARQQAYAARQQADAARQQAYAARQQFWKWCATVVCNELTRGTKK